MPVRLRKPLSPTLNEKLVRSYAEEAARLRDLAVNVTTIRLKTRLLEEADNQHRLAQAARRGIVQPHPIAHGQVVIGAQIFEADFRSLARHFV